MLLICPRCQAENEDVARFCNQCGTALDNSLPENRTTVSVPVEPAATASERGSVNWTALIVLFVAIAGIWYVVGSKPAPSEDGGMQAASAPVMEQVLEQIALIKQDLEDNPADMTAIREMFQLYGQVGKTDLVVPYAESAAAIFEERIKQAPGDVEAIRNLDELYLMLGRQDDIVPLAENAAENLKERLAQNAADLDAIIDLYDMGRILGTTEEVAAYVYAALDTLQDSPPADDPKEFGDDLLALFIAAYENRDDEACLEVLKYYHAQFPENARILKVLGDMSYDNLFFEQAREYYALYLDQTEQADDPENYLNAMTDMGSCYIQLYESGELDTNALQSALSTFEDVLAINPNFWQAHFNRGVAFEKLGNKAEATEEWEWCRDNTMSVMEAWRAEYAIADMNGEELPPMPVNPHDEGFGGMGGMSNPHGEATMANPHGEGTMANPHGEAAAPPLDGDNLPPNPHSEEFMNERGADSGSADDTDG